MPCGNGCISEYRYQHCLTQSPNTLFHGGLLLCHASQAMVAYSLSCCGCCCCCCMFNTDGECRVAQQHKLQPIPWGSRIQFLLESQKDLVGAQWLQRISLGLLVLLATILQTSLIQRNDSGCQYNLQPTVYSRHDICLCAVRFWWHFLDMLCWDFRGGLVVQPQLRVVVAGDAGPEECGSAGRAGEGCQGVAGQGRRQGPTKAVGCQVCPAPASCPKLLPFFSKAQPGMTREASKPMTLA